MITSLAHYGAVRWGIHPITIDSGHLGALYDGEAEETAVV